MPNLRKALAFMAVLVACLFVALLLRYGEHDFLEYFEVAVFVFVLAGIVFNYGKDFEHARVVFDGGEERIHWIILACGTACFFLILLAVIFMHRPLAVLACISGVYALFCFTNGEQVKTFGNELSKLLSDAGSVATEKKKIKVAASEYCNKRVWLAEENRPTWIGYLALGYLLAGLAVFGPYHGQEIKFLSLGAAILHLSISCHGYYKVVTRGFQERLIDEFTMSDNAGSFFCGEVLGSSSSRGMWLVSLLLFTAVLFVMSVFIS